MEPRNLYALLLKSKNLTTNGLAEKLGGRVEQSQLNRFESGKTKEPRRSTLQPVAEYFGLPVEVFYSEDLAAMVSARMAEGAQPGDIFPTAAQPIPQNVVDMNAAIERGEVTTRHIGTAKVVKPIEALPLSEDGKKWLARFLRTLHRVPPDQQVSALVAATEVLLDRLPDPPTAEQ